MTPSSQFSGPSPGAPPLRGHGRRTAARIPRSLGPACGLQVGATGTSDRGKGALFDGTNTDPSDAGASAHRRRLLARLQADERGAIFSEYVILTGLVAIVSIPAFLFAGAAVAHSFVFVRGYMLYPFP